MEHITPREAMDKLNTIVAKMKAGADYSQCKEEAQPYIDIINARANQVAKTYGMRPAKITFSSVAR